MSLLPTVASYIDTLRDFVFRNKPDMTTRHESASNFIDVGEIGPEMGLVAPSVHDLKTDITRLTSSQSGLRRSGPAPECD